MGVRILSLFDGMACGMLAMQKVGVEVDEYIAYEIDKYAIQTATHNFPMIKECGDVFKADFTQYVGVDYLIGGSPCTYWSIAKKENRETEASGLGWELFSQYARAVKEVQPKFFIYENNKSMSTAIRESITSIFGFEPICINSALVSAQSRQRLYWVGKRNADGTYSQVAVQQPVDKGITLNDMLMSCYTFNGIPLNTIKPVNTNGDKSWVLKGQYYKNGMANFLNDNEKGSNYSATGVAEPVLFGFATNITTPEMYAAPTEFENGIPIKATSCTDGKTYDVYAVKSGEITVRGKQRNIDLADGYYIIRKLTIKECKRLQTVPDTYTFPVSDAQAYKMLGNGWTVDVIAHLIKATVDM